MDGKKRRQIIAILAAASMFGLTACDAASDSLQVETPSGMSSEASEQDSAMPVVSEPESAVSNMVEQPETASVALTLEGRMDEAASRFGSMSCAQALATSYADFVGLDEDTAMNLAAGFGLGMGRRETCGAVTVMAMYAGLGGAGDQTTDMISAFEAEMGSVICQDFLDEYGYGNCTNCIRCAAGLLETRVFGEMPSQNDSNTILEDVIINEN